MPFKLHSKGRRHIPRQRHRVANWREYDASLRNRGSLTIWFTQRSPVGRRSLEQRRVDSAINPIWPSKPPCIASGVSIGASPERRIDGSIMKMLVIDLPGPDHRTPSRACTQYSWSLGEELARPITQSDCTASMQPGQKCATVAGWNRWLSGEFQLN